MCEGQNQAPQLLASMLVWFRTIAIEGKGLSHFVEGRYTKQCHDPARFVSQQVMHQAWFLTGPSLQNAGFSLGHARTMLKTERDLTLDLEDPESERASFV